MKADQAQRVTLSVNDGPLLKPGDILTIAGDYQTIANPKRRWWTFWRPRFITMSQLQRYRVQ